MTPISFFSSIEALKSESYTIDLYLSHVLLGQWKELIEPIRQLPKANQSVALRSMLPVVTLSGLFQTTTKGLSLMQHSGYIALDLDGFRDLERGKLILAQDRYTYAVFENCTGKSLTVLIRIQGSKHRESFQALSEYYENVCGLIVDQQDQLVTRLRYVSYDPHLRGNPEAMLFKI